MNALIVYAHPEPSSFCAALLHTAATTLRAAGHTVAVSDLHAMAFDPVSDRRNFTSVANASRLRQQAEEAHASAVGGYVPELRAEMDKLVACDLLVLVFPIWWLGLPAILKGWIDRVFAVGVAYGGGRYFGGGVMRGKRALCIVCTGGLADAYSGAGHYAPIEAVLYPIQRGVFEFTGFEALPPFVAYGPNHIAAGERQRVLDALRSRLGHIAAATSPSITHTHEEPTP
ncbi:MAG: NAD(P)H-dependent oxidoreductase [Burkholderiaceae bacterium]|nr:NAD(P)H-dependent oxidoreductase [Burkholderiaceae bacterium]